MSKDDLKQSDETASEVNVDSDEVAPKKKVVRKRTAAKKASVDETDANVSLDAGENGRFEFSPDDESDGSKDERSSDTEQRAVTEEKEDAPNEKKASDKKPNTGGNNRSKNPNRSNDRGGK